MRTLPDGLEELELSPDKEPRFVVQVSWDSNDSDYTYFTSSSKASVPSTSPAVDRVDGAVFKISGQTQKINPDIAASTIGSVTIHLLDIDDNSVSPALINQVSSRMQSKLDAGEGLRGKVIRVYVGYKALAFENYDLRLTYIVDSINYRDGLYKIKVSDIQRSARHQIFTPDETNLRSSITATDLIIPVVTIDTSQFPAMIHDGKSSLYPDTAVAFVKIQEEVIRHQGNVSFDTTNGWHLTAIERGALNTLAAEHDVSTTTEDNRKPKVIEHVYLESPSPKVITALYTGLFHSGRNVFPYPYDLTRWDTSTMTRTVSSLESPVAWGSLYNLEDTDVGSRQRIGHTFNTGVNSNELHTLSYFISKESTSTKVRVDMELITSSSYYRIELDLLDGSFTETNVSVTGESTKVYSFSDELWYVVSTSASIVSSSSDTTVEFIYGALTSDTGDFDIGLVHMTIGDNNGVCAIPRHWNLGIHPRFVRYNDFVNIGPDLWNPLENTGRTVRIENPGSQDGKKYIEKEMLLWMGCFSPIYSTGEVGLRKLAGVLSDASWLQIIDRHNVVSYSDLTHDMRAVINHIILDWNWVDSKEEYTKQSIFIDNESLAKHGTADQKRYKFKTVHVGVHSDEDILTYFDVIRDRYSGPPLLLSLKILPSMSRLEVGDVVKVQLDQIVDMNTNAAVDRAFEIQQVTTDWMTGNLNLKLFGSSQKAGTLQRTTLSTVLLDSFYTQLGTDLDGSPSPITIVGGVVTVGGIITGDANDIDAATAIYYYDGDLEIAAGVTVTVEENVQLRIKGNLTINGSIEGVGRGATGGTATTQFENGTTTTTYNNGFLGGTPSRTDYDYGEQGYFGQPNASRGLWTSSTSGSIPPNTATPISGQRFDYEQEYVLDPGALFGFTLGTYTNLDPTLHLESLPFYQLVNDQQTNTLKGYPKDLRGNAGAGGTPYIHTYGATSKTRRHLANGGAGGNGGAGLLIISRGLTFGANGEIDLSGADSSVGTGYMQATGSRFYGSAGAPGAPGALIVLSDGQHTNPDIAPGDFVAKYGDQPAPVGATEINLNWIYARFQYAPTISELAAYGDVVYSEGQNENTDVWQSAHRFQYIPEDETPVYQAGDESLFPKLSPDRYTETKLLTETATPAANQFFGSETAITSNGERMVVAANRAAATSSAIHVIRGTVNPLIEQTIASPSGNLSSFGSTALGIDETGSRLFAGDTTETVTVTANAGALYLFTRSGSVWSQEQKLTESTPVANNKFGTYVGWNKDNDKMLVSTFPLLDNNRQVYYFTRSGTIWTQQSTLVPPTAYNVFQFYDGYFMSGDGKYAAFGHANHAFGGGVVGAVYIYTRDGNTWNHTHTLQPTDVASEFFGRSQVMNYDGSALVCANQGSTKKIAVYHRSGDTFNLLQIIENSNVTSSSPKVRLSDDGLTMLWVAINDDIIVEYRRSDVRQAFVLVNEYPENDAGSASNAMDCSISRDASKLLISNQTSDIAGFTDTGAVHIWQKERKVQ